MSQRGTKVRHPQRLSEQSDPRRIPARGTYDKGQVDEIYREGLTCHVAFVADGRPVCIPMIYVKLEDKLYVHGSIASRLLKSMKVPPADQPLMLLLIGVRLAFKAQGPASWLEIIQALTCWTAVEQNNLFVQWSHCNNAANNAHKAMKENTTERPVLVYLSLVGHATHLTRHVVLPRANDLDPSTFPPGRASSTLQQNLSTQVAVVQALIPFPPKDTTR